MVIHTVESVECFSSNENTKLKMANHHQQDNLPIYTTERFNNINTSSKHQKFVYLCSILAYRDVLSTSIAVRLLMQLKNGLNMNAMNVYIIAKIIGIVTSAI